MRTSRLLPLTFAACTASCSPLHDEPPYNDPPLSVHPSPAPKPWRPVGEDPAAPMHPAPPDAPHYWIAVTTASGDLCTLEPTSGAVGSIVPARAADVIASNPHGFSAIEQHDEAPATMARYALQPDGAFHVLWSRELGAADARLIHSGSFTVGVMLDMGTSTFLTSIDGATITRACPPVASGSSRNAKDGVLVDLLEAHSSLPTLLTLLASESGLREVSRRVLGPTHSSCGARVVHTEDDVVLVDIDAGRVVLVGTDGAVLATDADAHDIECVEDAVWADDEAAVAVLTGARPRVHWLRSSGASTSIELPGQAWHDGGLRHRITFDAETRSIFAAVSAGVARVRVGPDGLLSAEALNASCSAESITLARVTK